MALLKGFIIHCDGVPGKRTGHNRSPNHRMFEWEVSLHIDMLVSQPKHSYSGNPETTTMQLWKHMEKEFDVAREKGNSEQNKGAFMMQG